MNYHTLRNYISIIRGLYVDQDLIQETFVDPQFCRPVVDIVHLWIARAYILIRGVSRHTARIPRIKAKRRVTFR